MSLKLYALVPESSTWVDLTDNVDFSLLDMDELGMPPVQNLTESGPQQHGSTFTGYRLRPRVFPLTLEATGSTFPELMENRTALTEIFAPRDAPLTLKFAYGDKERAIDCLYEDGLKFAWKDVEGYSQKAPVVLYAPEPTFYNPIRRTLTMGAGFGGTPFQVPTPVPTFMGASVFNDTGMLYYPGTWIDFPVVELLGPLRDPIVTNLATGERLDFTGTLIGDGERIVVDTRYAQKTVVDGTGRSVIELLVKPSHLATFHIAKRNYPNPFKLNPIQVTGQDSSTHTRVHIHYYERFLGI